MEAAELHQSSRFGGAVDGRCEMSLSTCGDDGEFRGRMSLRRRIEGFLLPPLIVDWWVQAGKAEQTSRGLRSDKFSLLRESRRAAGVASC